MSYEEISHKEVTGRKDYKCEWCGQTISKGDKHISRAYKFDGDFGAGRMHFECAQAMRDSSHDALADGWGFGELDRGVPMTCTTITSARLEY